MTWNLDPPPGFQGLHPDKPATMYQRHLPHWRQAGAMYFVTFRLGDSLPQARLDELKAFRAQWDRRHPPPRSPEQMDQLWRQTFLRVDRWLDEGMGSCRLREERAKRIVEDSLHHFDGQRYELGCFVVMPNHVHVVVRPFAEDNEALERVTHSWKRHMSRDINKLFGKEGALWQDESFDRIIRDEEHLWQTIQYIGRNPARAGLTRQDCPTWVSPAWAEIGWLFADRET